jgi:hypothetical protein
VAAVEDLAGGVEVAVAPPLHLMKTSCCIGKVRFLDVLTTIPG